MQSVFEISVKLYRL